MARALTTAWLSVALLAGCGPSFELAPPEGFVSLRRPARGFAHRSLTADGVVLAVRDVANEPQGPLDFWVEVIRTRLTREAGYELTGEREIRTASGQRGHQLRFGREDERVAYVYWMTIVPHGSRLLLVEAGGRRERFEPREAEIERAIAGLSLR